MQTTTNVIDKNWKITSNEDKTIAIKNLKKVTSNEECYKYNCKNYGVLNL